MNAAFLMTASTKTNIAVCRRRRKAESCWPRCCEAPGMTCKVFPVSVPAMGNGRCPDPTVFLIPVRDKDGLIQGMKIRLDEGEPSRKYRWLSSRNAPNGTRSYSWTHVTGSTASKRAYITEGPLKGDVASYLDNDTLFVCIGGVFALHGLKDTLISLGVTEVVETMDMDQMTNPQVRRAIQAIRQEVQSIRGIRYSKYVWNPAYKGIDDYYLSRIAAQ